MGGRPKSFDSADEALLYLLVQQNNKYRLHQLAQAFNNIAQAEQQCSISTLQRTLARMNLIVKTLTRVHHLMDLGAGIEHLAAVEHVHPGIC
jgi:hypothetical protein